MQYRLSVLLWLMALAVCATGCPGSGANKASNAEANAVIPNQVVSTPEGSDPAAVAAEAAPNASNSSNAPTSSLETDNQVPAAKKALEFPVREDDPDLEGKWFALFGLHDLGVMTHSWVDGHNVEFRKNGQAFWYTVVNGAEVGTLDSQWSRQGSTLKLSFSAAKAVEIGLSKLAPLGIGKDEEIGLTNTPSPGMNASAMVLLDTILDLELDHNYLVLRDGYSRLMVYGREANEGQGLPEGLAGGWVGKDQGNQLIAAEFELKGDRLQAQMNRKTYNFSGELAKGYYVGELIGPRGMDLVAFYYDDLGFLDGVIFAKPYHEVSMVYEFIKAPAEF